MNELLEGFLKQEIKYVGFKDQASFIHFCSNVKKHPEGAKLKFAPFVNDAISRLYIHMFERGIPVYLMIYDKKNLFIVATTDEPDVVDASPIYSIGSIEARIQADKIVKIEGNSIIDQNGRAVSSLKNYKMNGFNHLNMAPLNVVSLIIDGVEVPVADICK